MKYLIPLAFLATTAYAQESAYDRLMERQANWDSTRPTIIKATPMEKAKPMELERSYRPYNAQTPQVITYPQGCCDRYYEPEQQQDIYYDFEPLD